MNRPVGRSRCSVFPALLLALLAGIPAASAQTADERYLRVYSLISQADQLNGRDETRAAVTRYLEAQVALKDLQRLNPSWNTRIVEYRLDYISEKLGALTRGTGSGTAAGPGGGKGDNTGMLQSEIAKLAAQNAFLEAKLREALKVQPASIDPRELNRAEEQIRALQKERDLLAVTLEQSSKARQSAANTPDAQAAAVQQEKVTQTAVADVLKKQNDDLQKRIAELQIRLQGGTQTLPLKEAIAALQASNRVMKAEQVAMENRLLDLVKTFHTGSSEREKEWEAKLAEARAAAEKARKERDELTRQLETVTRELNKAADKPGPATPATAVLERQLEFIQAKLDLFESKAIPYSAEELALFRQNPIKVAATDTVSPPPTNSAAASDAAAAGRPGVPPPSAATVAALREIDRSIDARSLDEAERRLRELLRADENQPPVLAKLAALQLDQDKPAEAEDTLKKALALNAQDPASIYLMGSLRVRQQKFEEAIQLLSRSVKMNPDNAQAHYFLAQSLIQIGQRQTAQTELRRALQIKPNWSDAHHQLAVIYATDEPPSRGLAEYHYKRAIAGGAPRNPNLERILERPAR